MKNEYIPCLSRILKVIPHTEIEYTFRMAWEGAVKPGQFFEVSIPKYGEAPISVSGTGEGWADLTIRKVGKVTNEIFEKYEGDSLFLRGPYGNGFFVEDYKDRELLVVAGGTGLSPVKGVLDYYSSHLDEVKSLTLIVGFKSPEDILFREELKRWKEQFQVILTVDQAPEGSPYATGLVTEYIPKLAFRNIADAAAIVVGPPAMMHFSVQALLGISIPEEGIWISHERKMCCGIGKCGHCRINDTYVCLDGPVFPYTRGMHLKD